MYQQHAAAQALHALGAFDPGPTKAMLDSAAAAENEKKEARVTAILDAAGSHAAAEIRDAAIASLLEWSGTDAGDLDEGETMADRLLALAVGIADENKDGDISDDEADVINIALNAMADYAIAQGVTEEDAVALLADGDADAASRVAELLSSASGDDVDTFVFDGDSSASIMDSILDGVPSGDPIFDAVYKKKIAIRKGKKVRINKRVSGTVRLNAAQKVAIRKAGMKARSSVARMRRMKSMKLRRKTIG